MKLYQSRSGVQTVGRAIADSYGYVWSLSNHASDFGNQECNREVLAYLARGANIKFPAVFKAVRAGGVFG